MAVKAEKYQGFNPEEVDKQANSSLTHEDLIRVVGSDYQKLVDQRLFSLGLLKDEQSLVFNFPPEHKGSRAKYLFEGVIGNHWIFVYLLRNGFTSAHKHSHNELKIIEDYHLLKGKMDLHLGKRTISKQLVSDGLIELSEENNHTRVTPDTFHQAFTGDFAYVLVVMPNTASIPRDELHTPPAR